MVMSPLIERNDHWYIQTMLRRTRNRVVLVRNVRDSTVPCPSGMEQHLEILPQKHSLQSATRLRVLDTLDLRIKQKCEEPAR